MPIKYKLGAGDIIDILAITKNNQGAGSGLDSDKVDGREPGQANGLAELDSGGKVPSSQLPGLALTNVWTVASQAAQLALNAQEGDIAIRTDLNKSFAHNGGTSGTMADWSELLTPTDTVLSVFGRTGAVVAQANDYTWGQIDKAISSLADITTRSHTLLADVGTNTHPQIDSHLGVSSGIHGVAGSVVGTSDVQTLLNKLLQSPKIKDVDIIPVADVLLKVMSGILQARNSADSAYAPLILSQLAVGTPTVDGLVNVAGDTTTYGALFRVQDTKATPGGQPLFAFTNNTDTVFIVDNLGDVEVRRWLQWGEYNTAKYGRLAVPASDGFLGILAQGTDVDIDIEMRPQGIGKLFCNGRLRLKDVDATPVSDLLLQDIDEELQVKGINNDWATLTAGSLKAMSLATGSVPFIGTGGLLTEDNGSFYWNNINKFLGIGTNNPLARLHLHNQGDGVTDMRLGRSGGSTWGIYRYGSAGSDRFGIGVIGTNEPFSILTDGKVGIGTNTPKFLAHIAGRLGLGVPNLAPTDADLSNSEATAWLDETVGKLKFRIKKSDGTLVTAEVAYA